MFTKETASVFLLFSDTIDVLSPNRRHRPSALCNTGQELTVNSFHK
jgi:hypothetical protein